MDCEMVIGIIKDYVKQCRYEGVALEAGWLGAPAEVVLVRLNVEGKIVLEMIGKKTIEKLAESNDRNLVLREAAWAVMMVGQRMGQEMLNMPKLPEDTKETEGKP